MTLSRADRARFESWMTWFVAHLMRFIGRHWLLLANLGIGLYIGLAVLAPTLAHVGRTGGARTIYTLFSPLCHQLPERSFFLFGPQYTYTRAELVALAGGELSRRYVGSAQVGYKMAICERCTGIYAVWLGLGGCFALVRRRVKPARLRSLALLVAPIAIDGLGQLAGLWESTWALRLATGALFALALVWLTYPYLEQGMQDMHADALRMLEEVRRE